MGARPPKYDWPIKWPEPDDVPQWVLGGIIFFAGVFALFALGLVAKFIGAVVTNDDPKNIQALGLTILAIVGVPFAIWRTVVAQGNLDRAKDRDYADLFTKAVEQLGATRDIGTGEDSTTEPNLEVRIGAIYALERISHDSERDHIAIVEALCAYIRHNFSAPSLRPTGDQFTIPQPRIDLQAAITVLGRRSKVRQDFEEKRKFRLDLRRSNLSSVDFSKGNFSAAIFHYCRLEGSNFKQSKLNGTQFNGSLFAHSKFHDAELKGTIFNYCKMENSVEFGHLDSPRCCMSVIGAKLGGLDINSVDFHSIFGSRDTELNSFYEETRSEVDELRDDLRKSEGDKSAIKHKLNQTLFGHWSNLSQYDGKTYHLWQEFLANNGLQGWPYQ